MSILLLVAAMLLSLATAAVARSWTDWSPVTHLEDLGAHPNLNTPALEGCPIESPDGLELFLASNRDGGAGGLDIWVARRGSTAEPWGEPDNLGPPINSPDDDFCPSPMGGNRFFFVSTRPGPCGEARGADIYVSRRHPSGTFDTPNNVGCDVNSSGTEASPALVEQEPGGSALYFSSDRPSELGGSNLYVSRFHAGRFQPASLVPGVNSTASDARPNVGRDGRELVFDSNRSGGQGGFDVYVSRRHDVASPWSSPVNLGAAVNSAANETRPSLSADGTRLYVGSNRDRSEAGSSDLYVAERDRAIGR
jgi:Tol biopolymer transport system component